MQSIGWRWPGEKPIAVLINILLEAWSDGKAPGISPMGNPLPSIPGIIDTMAVSWAAYGVNRGIYRLLASLESHRAKASVMVNAVIAERSPEAIRAVADSGHELVAHSYGMDVVPLLLSEDEDRQNIARCTHLLEQAGGVPVTGWLSPRATSGPRTAALLAEAGYKWHGDVLDEDLPYVEDFKGKRMVRIPLSTDVNDMPSMKYGNVPSMMLESFEENLAFARRESGRPTIIDVTVHAHIFGRPRGAYYVDRIVQLAAAADDVWIGTHSEMADHILQLQST
jgi:hypothetical protein